MSNTYPVQQDQNRQNQELLESSEIGVLLKRAYLSAVNLSPRLAGVSFIELPAESKHAAGALPKWSEKNPTDSHVVLLRIKNVDGILDYFSQELAIRPAVVEHAASMLHINPDQMTPQLYYVFSMLHEMGHTDDYFDFEEDPEEFNRVKKVSEESLPLGRVSTKELLDPTSELYQKVLDDSELFDRHGVSTVHELAALNLTAYRNMRHERYADEFAAEVLNYEPELMDQLMLGTIDPYRNDYGFGEETA